MSSKNERIPLYAPDGRSLGFRTLEVALKLVAGGKVKPVYGPRKKLKALFLCQDEGGNPVATQPRAGTHYSYRERLGSGHRNWTHKKLDGKDENGDPVTTRDAFLQVIRDCRRVGKLQPKGAATWLPSRRADHSRTGPSAG